MALYVAVFVLHVVVSIILVVVILLQAGKGGGLSDTFGGGTAQNIFGSRAGDFLSRATSVCAIVFLITSLSLALMSSQHGKSLLQQKRMLKYLQEQRENQAKTQQDASKQVTQTQEATSSTTTAVGQTSIPPAQSKVQ